MDAGEYFFTCNEAKLSNPLQGNQGCTVVREVAVKWNHTCGTNYSVYGGVTFKIAGFNLARFSDL